MFFYFYFSYIFVPYSLTPLSFNTHLLYTIFNAIFLFDFEITLVKGNLFLLLLNHHCSVLLGIMRRYSSRSSRRLFDRGHQQRSYVFFLLMALDVTKNRKTHVLHVQHGFFIPTSFAKQSFLIG